MVLRKYKDPIPSVKRDASCVTQPYSSRRTDCVQINTDVVAHIFLLTNLQAATHPMPHTCHAMHTIPNLLNDSTSLLRFTTTATCKLEPHCANNTARHRKEKHLDLSCTGRELKCTQINLPGALKTAKFAITIEQWNSCQLAPCCMEGSVILLLSLRYYSNMTKCSGSCKCSCTFPSTSTAAVFASQALENAICYMNKADGHSRREQQAAAAAGATWRYVLYYILIKSINNQLAGPICYVL